MYIGKESEDSCAILQYFKEFLGGRDSGISKNEFIPMLKKCVVLITNDKLKTPDAEAIHFSSNYFTSGENLVGMFPGKVWSVRDLDELHLVYLIC